MTKPSCFRRFLPLLTTLILCLTAGTLLAQEERWLLIFDTSANMKKRLPAIDLEVTKIFLASSGQHIHAGDSVGVWAFGNNQLHAGQMPLFTYDPTQAAVIATNVLKYFHGQTFKGLTTFDPLQPALDTVIQNSQRLTIIILCDGDGEIQGTPYDYAINQDMLGSIPGQKKLKQPVVVILRSQKGKYVGGTVNLPPESSRVPEFPPLPAPPTPAPAPVVAAPAVEAKPASPSLQALIINGTAISTNPDVIPAYAPKPAASHTPATPVPAAPAPTIAPVAVAVAPAVPVAPAPAPAAPTLAPPAPAAPAVVPTQIAPEPAPTSAATPAPVTAPAVTTPSANATATAPANDTLATASSVDTSTKILLVVGGIFFGMALLLVIFFLTRKKQPPASLITSIMTDDPNRRR